MPSSPFFCFSASSRLHTLTAAIALLVSLGLSGVASGETLKEALAAAYLFNPTLKSARATLRSIDNGVAQAKSGYRPTITGTLTDAFEDTRERLKGGPLAAAASQGGTGSSLLPNGTYNPRTAAIGLQQNIFDGFRTYNAVKGPSCLSKRAAKICDRASRASSKRRHGLYERGPRSGDREFAAKQYQGSCRAASRHGRQVQGGRSHPHRCGTGAGHPGERPGRFEHRARYVIRRSGVLSAVYRTSSGNSQRIRVLPTRFFPRRLKEASR